MTNEVNESKSLEYYMELPYAVEVSHDEDGYFARVEDLPGCSTYTGPDGTPGELFELIEDAKRGWIADALEHGDPVPEPRSTESYSGKVVLRMPKSLHRDLARRAKDENVSLNQLMLTGLARIAEH